MLLIFLKLKIIGNSNNSLILIQLNLLFLIVWDFLSDNPEETALNEPIYTWIKLKEIIYST